MTELEKARLDLQSAENFIAKWTSYRERLLRDRYYEFRGAHASCEAELQMWLEECDESIDEASVQLEYAREDLAALASV